MVFPPAVRPTSTRKILTVSDSTTPLQALCPLDGRYHETVAALAPLMSEESLIRQRIRVEAHWLLLLGDHPQIYPGTLLGATMSAQVAQQVRLRLEALAAGHIAHSSAAVVKDHERRTRHDVKAVEYYLRDELKSIGASSQLLAFVHFACTSEDINNLAYGLMMQEVREETLLPTLSTLIGKLQSLAQHYSAHPMLSRTHGQVASPTTMGKELAVFAYRLRRQHNWLQRQEILGKCAGAVGNYNAHMVAYPDINWPELAQNFVEKTLSLSWNPLVTQIESHDALAELLSIIERISTINIDLCRDMWSYISLGYFRQKICPEETGSSTMPHKVNPIDFENAEGNFGLARSLASHLAHKLPISRWQRDLSDSTVMRSLGTMLGYYHVAMMHLLRGLGKVHLHPPALLADLDDSWEVLAEAVQTLWRKHGVVDAYEQLKELTRGRPINSGNIKEIIDAASHKLDLEDGTRLMELSPRTYLGGAEQLAHSNPPL